VHPPFSAGPGEISRLQATLCDEPAIVSGPYQLLCWHGALSVASLMRPSECHLSGTPLLMPPPYSHAILLYYYIITCSLAQVEHGMTIKEVDNMMNKKSGFLGLTGADFDFCLVLPFDLCVACLFEAVFTSLFMSSSWGSQVLIWLVFGFLFCTELGMPFASVSSSLFMSSSWGLIHAENLLRLGLSLGFALAWLPQRPFQTRPCLFKGQKHCLGCSACIPTVALFNKTPALFKEIPAIRSAGTVDLRRTMVLASPQWWLSQFTAVNFSPHTLGYPWLWHAGTVDLRHSLGPALPPTHSS
jgi:hypothetical protein